MLVGLFDRLTKLSLRLNWITIALALAILIIGGLALGDLNQELVPRVDFPQTIVVAQWGDAESAQAFLEAITIPLELALQEVNAVVNVESTTNQGFAIIIVRNEFGVNQDRIVADIESAVAAVNLPATAEAPQVLSFSLSDLPIISASISSPDLTLAELKALVAEDLVPRLEAIDQVSQVTVGGGQELPPEEIAAARGEPGADAGGTAPLETTAEPPPTASPTPTATPSPTPPPTTEPAAATTADPAALPPALVQGAATAGLTLRTVDDITPDLMRQIAALGPAGNQFLALLSPDNLRLLRPEVLALLPAGFLDSLPPDLRAELDALAAGFGGAGGLTRVDDGGDAAAVPAPDAVPLPDSWTRPAAAIGAGLASTADVTPGVMQNVVNVAPQLLADLSPAMWRALDPLAFQIALPALAKDFDATLLDQLRNIQAASLGRPAEPVPLPADLVQTAASFNLRLGTTADVTPEVGQIIVDFAPQLLSFLDGTILTALSPDVLALLPAELLATLDEGTAQTIVAIVYRDRQFKAGRVGDGGAPGGSEAPPPTPAPPAADTAARLPDTLIQGLQAFGLSITRADEVTPDLMRQLSSLGPQATTILGLLSGDNLRALPAESIALLPTAFLDSLDPVFRQELDDLAAEFGGAGALYTAEQASADPARLPEVLIQAAAQFGQEIELASDLGPEFIRLLGAAGEQGLQALQLLTPANLRALPVETIGWLPAAFLDSLDPALRSELDELAAGVGGAGQLAASDAAARAAAAADAPVLSGIWILPGPNGEESQFQTAADILNNAFAPTAGDFLNFFVDPNAQVEQPAQWLGDLTPEILRYLAANETSFVATLAPPTLELLSPASLRYLLNNHAEAFDPELTERLEAIAAGEVTVFVPEATIARTNANPALVLSIFKDGDANTVAVSRRVFEFLDDYTANNAEVDYEVVFEQSSFIEQAIEGVTGEAVNGGIFAILIILLFLSGQVRGRYRLSWRAIIVTGVSIPLSILAAIMLMRWIPSLLGQPISAWADDSGSGLVRFVAQLFPTEFTLNILTLSGLTVAIGRVVDDSIVVLENSYRYIQQGVAPRQAAIDATREVAIAIFAATVTTMAVFLPLGLVGGIISSFFLPFGLTVSYALAASFLVSITVVPVLIMLLIRPGNIPELKDNTLLQRLYTPSLQWSLSHRLVTLILAAAVFAASLVLLTRLPQSFIPELGEPSVNVAVSLPAGTRMAETNFQVQDFERQILVVEGVTTVQTEVGSGGGVEAFFGGGSVNQAAANLIVTVGEEFVTDQEALGDLTIQIRRLAEGAFGAENVTVAAGSIASFGNALELNVKGAPAADLAAAVPALKEILAGIDLDGNGSPDVVNLTSNVDAQVGDAAASIIRVDGEPAISLSGEYEFGTQNTIGIVDQAIQEIESAGVLPAGAVVSRGFDSEQQAEGFRGVVTAIGWASLLVYLVMALAFRSLVHPFTILFSLPLSLIGAALALTITGRVLGISSMIGLLMLVGIVTTNGIVLMEFVKQLRERGLETDDALVEGGRVRLRPILMTALATILALVPLALSNEAGAIIAADLAWTVLGGMLVGTLLTLIIIPVVYSALDQGIRAVTGGRRSRTAAGD